MRAGGWRSLVGVGAAVYLLAGPATAEDSAEREQVEFFEAKIRPVLVEHCYGCHGTGEDGPKGGLRLDHRDGLLVGGDGGPALVAGKPDESVLIQALRYDGYEMPPDGRLPDSVVADFEMWVRDGAVDPREEEPAGEVKPSPEAAAAEEHWAFVPPVANAVPDVRDGEWPRTRADRFVLAKLEESGLRPSGGADRHSLARRLYFDLVGLPPTPEEVEAFVGDASPDAYERLVERLLASPRFGEAWGRHWLDVARYADSNGGDFNATFYHAWRYRDYVIDALNVDKPYDEFVLEQVAGDLLPASGDADRYENVVATGFLAVGPKMLSERDKEKMRMDVVDEQLDSIGKAFLGLTVGCARCHDHKFDPIPARDYYAMAGILRSTVSFDGEIQKYVSDVVNRDLPIEPPHAAALAAHGKRAAEAAEVAEAAKKALAAAEAALKALGEGPQVVVDDAEAKATGEWMESTFHKTFVGAGYRHDDNAAKGERSLVFVATLPAAGRYEVQLAYNGGKGRARNVPVEIRHAEGTTKVTLDEEPAPKIEKLYASLGTFRFEAGEATVTVSNAGTTGHVIADAVRFVAVDLSTGPADPMRLAEAARGVDAAKAAVAAAEGAVETLKSLAPPPAPQALSIREAGDIGDCNVRIRGESSRLGEAVPRGFLSCCGESTASIPANESGRRELAAWLTRPGHPLTARVYVNRVWMRLFGEGIVRSVDHFGRHGEAPSHPELLDDLAVRFVAGGWSTKRLVRELVLSAAYRQASAIQESSQPSTLHPQLLDPDNRLLWRMNRKRLGAEALRDAMLAVAGRLDDAPSVAPVAQLGQLAVSPNGEKNGEADVGAASRSVYLPVVRNELPAVLTVFDFADPEAVVGRRPATNVPAQALFLLNSPFVREAADASAGRVAELSADEAVGVDRLYRMAVSRTPTDAEVERATAFLRDGSDRRAGWAALVQAVFASTEFRMVE